MIATTVNVKSVPDSLAIRKYSSTSTAQEQRTAKWESKQLMRVFLSSGMLNSESPEHKKPDSYGYIYDQVRIEERLRE